MTQTTDIPWGLGAAAADEAPSGWKCPGCGHKAKRRELRLLFGDIWMCVECAHATYEDHQ